MACDRATGSAPIHGGLRDEELAVLAVDRARVLDFSVSTNPYGPCPAVVDAIRRAPIARYPDPTAHDARQAVAAALGALPGSIALGNGAADLLWILARTLLGPGVPALIVEPTFAEFRAAAAAAGARIAEWRARQREGFALDLDAIGAAARRSEARVVYLCTPNTPTGAGLAADAIARWAAARPAVAIVLDQSFLSLSQRFADLDVPMPANVVRVRSLTKDHGIPGVRVGYLVATPELAGRVEAQRPAWSVGAPALAAAVAALGEVTFVAESRASLLADRARSVARLRQLGLAPVDSTTIFFLVEVEDPARLRADLLTRHHVLVRDCASFGLPRFIRIAARPTADVDRLVAALGQELGC